MDSDRSADQVIASARGMDAARAAGLPDELLIVLLNARQAWWGKGPWPDPVDLIRAVSHPASRVMDETLHAAIRRHLG